MILVDTSIWVDHLRKASPQLQRLLADGQVGIHPWIIGEISLGNLHNREEVLARLAGLPHSVLATAAEVQELVTATRIYGRGISFVDAQLLASARISPDTRLWTGDRRLHAVAQDLGVAAV